MVDVEAEIRAARERGDLHAAATLALEAYGPELLGFLVSLLGDPDAADEAFAQLGEDLWRGLPGFEARSSARTWLYTLARHAAYRLVRGARVRNKYAAPASQISAVAEAVRTRTLPFLRTEARDGIARLRAALDPDDRALLVLRLDRNMSWTEVAAVLAPDEEPVRAAARLRKRFQLVKDRLRERARELGLVGERKDDG
ncbi:MAG: RNA polymerase sigma factor [Myxococcales bacterium]|nr:RNA polymerase sigma factor [Myxococcales bacterium]